MIAFGPGRVAASHHTWAAADLVKARCVRGCLACRGDQRDSHPCPRLRSGPNGTIGCARTHKQAFALPGTRCIADSCGKSMGGGCLTPRLSGPSRCRITFSNSACFPRWPWLRPRRLAAMAARLVATSMDPGDEQTASPFPLFNAGLSIRPRAQPPGYCNFPMALRAILPWKISSPRGCKRTPAAPPTWVRGLPEGSLHALAVDAYLRAVSDTAGMRSRWFLPTSHDWHGLRKAGPVRIGWLAG